MDVVKTIPEVRSRVAEWRAQGLSVGLVTTMGYLHAGHQSLIKKAVEQNDRVVVTVFVNPTQFGPTEDLDAYPRDLDHDAKLAAEVGASLLFNPEPAEMYPEGFGAHVKVDGLTEHLDGLARPVHFGGVCTVLTKFFHIVSPDRAYFGQKDAQQLAIVKKMVTDLNFPLQIVGCPIVREPDGLAMSSRNTYLSPEERTAALCLSRSIFAGQKLVENGERNAQTVIDAMTKIISAEPMARIDYVAMVDNHTMEDIDVIKGDVLCAIAVYINEHVRLIDNFMIDDVQ